MAEGRCKASSAGTAYHGQDSLPQTHWIPIPAPAWPGAGWSLHPPALWRPSGSQTRPCRPAGTPWWPPAAQRVRGQSVDAAEAWASDAAPQVCPWWPPEMVSTELVTATLAAARVSLLQLLPHGGSCSKLALLLPPGRHQLCALHCRWQQLFAPAALGCSHFQTACLPQSWAARYSGSPALHMACHPAPHPPPSPDSPRSLCATSLPRATCLVAGI